MPRHVLGNVDHTRTEDGVRFCSGSLSKWTFHRFHGMDCPCRALSVNTTNAPSSRAASSKIRSTARGQRSRKAHSAVAGKDPQIHTVFDAFSRRTRRTVFKSQGSQSSTTRMEAAGGRSKMENGVVRRATLLPIMITS